MRQQVFGLGNVCPIESIGRLAQQVHGIRSVNAAPAMRARPSALQRLFRALCAFLIAAASSLFLAAPIERSAGQQASEAPRRSSAWQPTDCIRFKVRVEEEQVECGYVSVPRRHSDPTGPAIRLATVIIKSQASNRAPQPLFIAQGGPGGSSIDS